MWLYVWLLSPAHLLAVFDLNIQFSYHLVIKGEQILPLQPKKMKMYLQKVLKATNQDYKQLWLIGTKTKSEFHTVWLFDSSTPGDLTERGFYGNLKGQVVVLLLLVGPQSVPPFPQDLADGPVVLVGMSLVHQSPVAFTEDHEGVHRTTDVVLLPLIGFQVQQNIWLAAALTRHQEKYPHFLVYEYFIEILGCRSLTVTWKKHYTVILLHQIP